MGTRYTLRYALILLIAIYAHMLSEQNQKQMESQHTWRTQPIDCTPEAWERKKQTKEYKEYENAIIAYHSSL